MQNIHKPRFLAANYANLQGLKAVPVGLLLLLVVLWADAQRGPARDLSLPLLLSLGAGLLLWVVERYYRARFGRVERTPRQKRFEIFLGLAGSALGLGAFILDTSLRLPFSLIGLVFAAAVVAEYLRMQWYAPGKYLLPLSLASFLILLVVSILPLLGAGEWWLGLGLRAQLTGVLAVAGAVTALNGLVGHAYFVRQLPPGEA